MNCPTCGGAEHRVLRTDLESDGRIRRTRACPACGKRWRTFEVPSEVFERAADIIAAFERMKQVIPGEG